MATAHKDKDKESKEAREPDPDEIFDGTEDYPNEPGYSNHQVTQIAGYYGLTPEDVFPPELPGGKAAKAA